MKQLYIIFLVFFFVNISALSQINPVPVVNLVNQDRDIPKEVIKASREFRERLLSDPY